jgi:hypothetical protein
MLSVEWDMNLRRQVAFCYGCKAIEQNATAPRTFLSHQAQGEKPLQPDQEDCMTHLALFLFEEPDVLMSYGMWAFLSIGAVSLFVVFIPLTSWIDARRKEREAFYRADTIRRLAESSGEGARAAIELLREEDRLKRLKTLEGLKIGGVITMAVGVALTIFLGFQRSGGLGDRYLVGLIPGLVGLAMLVYVFFLAAPVDGQGGK